jgi:FkbM family methyltransferase
MGSLSDTLRYFVLRNPQSERIAHRIEVVVRTFHQRRKIRAGGRIRTAPMGTTTVPLDLGDLREYLMYQVLSSGGGFAYEPGTTRVVLNAVTPDAAFIDVGANLGYFTLVVLGRLSPAGTVLALEPNPETFRRLEQIVAPHDTLHRVRLVNSAGSDVESSTVLYHSPVDHARDSLTPVGPSGVEVNTVRLDSFDFTGRRVVVKIDAEGAEERVLRGMRGILETAVSLSIAMEWNPPRAGESLWNLINESFDVARIDERLPGRLTPVHSLSEIRRRLTNLWMVRR